MKIEKTLTPDQIQAAVEGMEKELERVGITPEMQVRFRLSFEEILIIMYELLGDGTPFCVASRTEKGEFLVTLSVDGEETDPFTAESPILDRVAGTLDFRPVWEYRGKTNIVLFRFTLYNAARKNYKFAWKYVREHRKLLFFSIIIQFISVILGVVAPVLSAKVVVRYMDNQVTQVIVVAAVLLAVQLLKNLLLVGSNKGYNKVYSGTLNALEEDLVMGALHIKNHCMEEKGSGLFIQRLTNDTARMATGFGRIADMIAQAVNYIGILLAMMVINPFVFLLALVLLLIESFMEIYRTKRLCADDRIYRNANEKFSGFISEMVRGARDVKQLNSEDAFCREAKERVVNANDKRLLMQKNSWSMKLVRWEFSEFGTFLFITLLALFMGWGWLSAATIVVLYNYYSSLDVRAITLAGEFMEYVKGFNLSIERVCALMNSPEFPKERFGEKELENPRGEIRFENVTFSYGAGDPLHKNRKVLDKMSFSVREGEMVALVGKSGCGKTTVLNLLSRLYDPQGGRILLDGVNIGELTKDSIRNTMTVVNQAPYIFNMTVRENLRLAKADMTEAEMKEVCELACIDEDIRQMPDGYDTVIGEGGVNMSGGQRQRLAIARSLLKDYRIILFDEATSALDNVTQAKIQKAIDSISKDRTIILIAHRLSTVIGADRILYMQDGKVLAEGDHEELLKKCLPYRLLYQEESGGE